MLDQVIAPPPISLGDLPGGSSGQVQWNNGGNFGGISGATTDGTTLTLIAPILGTPASCTATNFTGTAAGLTAGNVTTNANLTGDVTSVGNATTLANIPAISGANLTTLNGTNISSGTVADVRLSANVPLLNVANTFTAKQIISGASFALSGNISASAWTTNGIRYANVPATLTDTTSSGTVASAFTDVFGGNTIAALSAVTFTKYSTMRIPAPTAGTNVTFTNAWSADLDSLTVGTSNPLTISAAGAVTFNAALTYGGVTLSNSVTGTGAMVLANSPAFITPGLGAATATSINVPLIKGGGSASIALVIESTSGAGTTDSISFKTGSQVTALTIDTNQKVSIASGKIFQLGNAATTGLTAGVLAATTNSTIVITDSTGQAYRIPCII